MITGRMRVCPAEKAVSMWFLPSKCSFVGKGPLRGLELPIDTIAPISDGDVQRGARDEQHPQDARKRAWYCHLRMMNGSSQDWKFTTMRRYTSKMEQHPQPEADERVSHRLHLAPDVVLFGAGAAEAVHHLLDIRRHAAQVPAIRVRENVEQRLDVVAIHQCGRLRPVHRHQVVQVEWSRRSAP